MNLVLLLVVIALIVGGIGLVVEGLKWLLVLAAIVLAVGIVTGVVGRRGRTPRGGEAATRAR